MNDMAVIRVAKKFVEWWGGREFYGPEYNLARDAFITGFMAPLVNASGIPMNTAYTNSLRVQIEETINMILEELL